MCKTLAFISTHVINRAVISEYVKLSKVQNCDCILAIDNTSLNYLIKERITEKEFYGTTVRCFFFDKTVHNELDLPWFSENRETDKFQEIMWYNCDYRFYYVKKYYPNYDYYWQFEYDIFCNGTSYQAFFDKYSNHQKDLLILNFRKEQVNGNWYWSKNMAWQYGISQIYGSLFPIVRLSGTAVDYLYKQRIAQKDIYKSIKNKKHACWPYCELFVPTELATSGFTVFGMEEKQISWNQEYDLNEDRLFEHPDDLLYHPVKGQFLEREKKLKNEILRLNEEKLSTRIRKVISWPIKKTRYFLRKVLSWKN